MARLNRTRAGTALLLVSLLVGCGPTAEAIVTPTPPPGGPLVSIPFRTVVPPTATSPSAPAPTSTAPIDLSTPSGPVGSPSPTSPTSPASAQPSGGVGPTLAPGERWIHLTDFPASGAFEVTSVAAALTGFVAVGFKAVGEEGFFGRRQGVIWRSEDGRTWTETVPTEFEFVTPEDVAVLGDAVFVFGSVETCDFSTDDECVEPLEAGWGIWRLDGAGWERLPTPASMASGTMDGVAVANGALEAFGWASNETQSPIVWRSTDGVTWAESTNVAGMDPITTIGGVPAGVAAFGSVFDANLADLRLIAAYAADGINFAPANAPALSGTTIQGITSGPTGVVAVGDGDNVDVGFDGVVLFSTDGVTWTAGSAIDSSFSGATLRAVHAIPAGYVALGMLPESLDAMAAGASWFSADGLNWQMLSPLGGTFSLLETSAAGPTGIVAFTVSDVGFDDEAESSTVDAWFGPVDALVP
ncbi:MAG: hypothetical protein ABIP53_10380 [Candidatus Limnocylindrales bacterium]